MVPPALSRRGMPCANRSTGTGSCRMSLPSLSPSPPHWPTRRSSTDLVVRASGTSPVLRSSATMYLRSEARCEEHSYDEQQFNDLLFRLGVPTRLAPFATFELTQSVAKS